MLKPKILNHQNFQLEKKHKETVEGISKTIPNEAYTIQEMYARAMAGLEDQDRPTVYIDENDPILQVLKPDFDLTDLDNVKQYIADIEKKSAEAIQQKKEAEKEKTVSPAPGLKQEVDAIDSKEQGESSEPTVKK